MRFLTDFADQDVVLPIAAVVLLILLLTRWWRGAAAWGAVVGVSFGSILLLKLTLEACGPGRHPVIYSPSGHAMAGTVIYGGVLALLGLSLPASVTVAVLIAALIGWSRVWLGLHTVPEVVLGGAFGVAGVAALQLLAGAMPGRRRLRATVPVAVLLLAGLLHGRRSSAEAAIQQAAHQHVAPILQCGASSA